MKLALGIGIIGLAATLTGPAALAQATARAHSASGTAAAETPYLGVGGQDVSTDRAKALKLKEERGVEVTSVFPDSAAAKAGLKEGDVVLEFNGQKVEGWEHLKRLVRETPVHRDVKLNVWRNGAVQTLTANMGSQRGLPIELGDGTMMMPEMRIPMAPNAPITPMPQLDMPQFRTMMGTPSLGIMGESLSQESQLAEFFGVKEGVLVRSVNKNSAAEKAGLKAGDVITKIDDSQISSPPQINSVLRAARNKGTVNVVVVRNKKEMTLSVTPETGGMYRGGLWDAYEDNDTNPLLRLFRDSDQRAVKIVWN